MNKFQELVTKLREIFQIDRPELDFGIYRILNARAGEISDYLENRLAGKVRQALSSGNEAQREQVARELKEKEAQYQADGINPDTVPKVQELRQKLAQYSIGVSEHENAVFSHLLIFFSRYYDQGDFISQRAPTEKNPQRTLLEKHLTTYTTRNTADYFIHKNLGGFLRRELDFYIKNEVMNLDDVQNAGAFADIEKNLRMIQCLRGIGLELITFLFGQGQGDLLAGLPQSVKDDYLLNYLLDVESRDSLLSVEDFRKPFDYMMNIAVDSAGAFEPRKIDLVETFNYLIGLRVKHIDMQPARGFVTVTGTLPSGESCLILWRDCEKVDYEGVSKLCEKLAINPADNEFDVVYINGDHNIPTKLMQMTEDGGATRELNLRQIEQEFLERMFSVEDV